MSLQRRLLLYLVLCAPLVWAVALWVSVDRARHEVNELFDSEMIRLARQVQATLPGLGAVHPRPDPAKGNTGDADVGDLAIAVWDAKGELQLADREGQQLTRHEEASGFIDEQLGGETWRVYYLQAFDGAWLVAAGQKLYERDEVVYSLTLSQVLPWVLVLPVLLVGMAWAVRRALAPVHQLAVELEGRSADDLQPVPEDHAPAELKPLMQSMNALFRRIDDTLARERRFTADAAHELRTPLAVLRAQWDVLRRTGNNADRAAAEARLDLGFDRLDRLVTQMLALSRVDTASALPHPQPVAWAPVVEQAVSDCLPLAERRAIDFTCEWPERQADAFPLFGDSHLLTVMLRNLLDNALRYAPPGSAVTLRFARDRVELDNDGEPLGAARRERLGERFRRPDGQEESGSGLGVSIVQRIASLHGLSVAFGARADGRGVRVTLRAA